MSRKKPRIEPRHKLRANAPVMILIDPKRGYVKGNTEIVSREAADMINTASAAEHRRIASVSDAATASKHIRIADWMDRAGIVWSYKSHS